MEAEEDAERLLRRTEKRAFAAFKISFSIFRLYALGESVITRKPRGISKSLLLNWCTKILILCWALFVGLQVLMSSK